MTSRKRAMERNADAKDDHHKKKEEEEESVESFFQKRIKTYSPYSFSLAQPNLQQIFEFLNIKDLSHCRRVCRDFDRFIGESKKLYHYACCNSFQLPFSQEPDATSA